MSQQSSPPPEASAPRASLLRVEREAELPAWASRDALATFFHETMKPYEDSVADIHRALDYAFASDPGRGGFLQLAAQDGQLAGALLMLATGMGGYVPEHLLVFVTVRPELRGQGLGRRIIEAACADLPGAVKLHVEYENPARRLYERLGFVSRYAEMRRQP